MMNIYFLICVLSITIGVYGMYDDHMTDKNKTQLTCRGEGYELYSTGSCYRLHLDRKVFDDANQTCLDEGAYLVEVNDKHEAQVIKDIEGLPAELPWTYVGLRAMDYYGDWRTANGTKVEELYNVWVSVMKPPYTVIVKCATILNTGVLDNVNCYDKRAFLCEKKPLGA